MKRLIATNTNKTTNDYKGDTKMKTRIYTDKNVIDKYVKAYNAIWNYTVEHDPIFSETDNDGFSVHHVILFEDYIAAILNEHNEKSSIDIIANYDDSETFQVVLRMLNKASERDYIINAVYTALEIGKKVLVNGKDITTIDFEY